MGACATYGQPVDPATVAPSLPPLTGTVLYVPGGGAAQQPDCASFNARYCASSDAPITSYGNQRPDGVITQVNFAGTGEGRRTPYCQNIVATQWCNDPNPVIAQGDWRVRRAAV